MIAASVWSLLIPAIDMAEASGVVAWVPAVAGFLSGVGFLLLLDTFVPHLHLDTGARRKSLRLGQIFDADVGGYAA